MEMRGFYVNILDPRKIRICREESGRLKLIFDNDEKVLIKRVVRAFPLTMPWRYIILIDENDREVGLLRDLGDLDETSMKVLKDELERVYFIPKIKKIHRIKEEFGVLIWETETDKGPRRFEVTSRRDVKKMGKRRIIVRDADGNLYDIPDYADLDQKSIILLESVI
ncbi:DUF1854 domain-containing protein [Candidatus Bathyarchaeota archaeon]|nr:MAG: DUF1854 domain-containing protein [Candidatus Bathyarchaeota archaeon]